MSGKGVVESVGDPFSVVTIGYESKIDPIQLGDRYRIIHKKESEAPAAAVDANKIVVKKIKLSLLF